MKLKAIACTLVLLLGLIWGRQSIEAQPQTSGEPLLYLPNGTYLKVMSLGHASVLADWMYVWAIQYYGNYDMEQRYEYVEHVFRNVITELDPHYVDAYWMGAMILSVEAKDLPAALRLLDDGIEDNPDEWLLPYLAAWEAYNASSYDLAEQYFAKAAAVKDAPAHVKRLQLGMIGRQGDLERALKAWQEVLQDPQSDNTMKQVAKRQINTILVELDCRALEQAAQNYKHQHGKYPDSLDRLRREGYISHLPLDPQGLPYQYDSKTGKVTSLAGRLLGNR